MFLHAVILTLSLVSLSVQQNDPMKDFCRLFGHQTTVVDRSLYIDGGIVNWGPITEETQNYTSKTVVYSTSKYKLIYTSKASG